MQIANGYLLQFKTFINAQFDALLCQVGLEVMGGTQRSLPPLPLPFLPPSPFFLHRIQFAIPFGFNLSARKP